jgi:hypothetical protein
MRQALPSPAESRRHTRHPAKITGSGADLLNVRWIADADLRISGCPSPRLRAGVLTANFESIRYRGSGVFR